MNPLMQVFYTLTLWATRFELAVALAAPQRNHRNIEALQRDESEYERELIQLRLNV